MLHISFFFEIFKTRTLHDSKFACSVFNMWGLLYFDDFAQLANAHVNPHIANWANSATSKTYMKLVHSQVLTFES